MKYNWPRNANPPGVPRIQVAPPRAELKGMDTNLATAGNILATTGTNVDVLPLNLIAPGTGSFNRIGRKANLKSLLVEMTIEHVYSAQATTNNLTGNVVRVAIVWDKQPNGTLPVYSEIFSVTDQAGTEGSNYFDPPKYDNRERFKILRDEKAIFNIMAPPLSGGSGNTVVNYKLLKAYVKLPADCATTYSGQSATQTIADISTGALYVVLRSAIDSTDNFLLMRGGSYARLRYTD